MVFLVDLGDELGKEWVNSPKTYPVESFGPMRSLPDSGDIEFVEPEKYKILGLLIESRRSSVLSVVYKTDLEGDFFKYIVKPGERRWVVFPSSWKVRVFQFGDETHNAVYDVWAEV